MKLIFVYLDIILIGVCVTRYFVKASENMALRKPASQSSTMLPYVADRAVDGNTGNLFFEDNSCSHTAHGKNEAWWQVNLLQLSNIKDISIYYRNNFTERFWGFHLYVSNTSDWSSGYLCHKHKGPDLPDEIQNVSCPAIGQFVTIVNFRNQSYPTERKLESTAYLELCEVQVYGCAYGRYGKDCSKYCSEDCLQVNCDADSGTCNPRCQDGWKGVKCNEYCDYGSFGSGCRGRCYCMQGTCDPVSGICPTGGCQGGWSGQSCNQACAPFTYGPDCKFSCHCKNKTCDRFTGKCLHGCVEGWVGPNCNQGRRCRTAEEGEYRITYTCQTQHTISTRNHQRTSVAFVDERILSYQTSKPILQTLFQLLQ